MTTKLKRRVRATSLQSIEIRSVSDTTPPPGCCGSVTTIGLRYNRPDAYGTIFKPGCLTKTVGQKVSAGNVKYYADHEYTTHAHIGVVRAVEDVGDDVLVTADIFDTDEGKAYLQYAKSCLAAKAQTGCSIGFYDRACEMVDLDGERYLAYTEVELEEFSATPNNAVDGADLLAARHKPGERPALLLRALHGLFDAIPEADVRAAFAARFASGTPAGSGHADSTDTAAPAARNAGDTDSPATMDDRLAAVRQSFASR